MKLNFSRKLVYVAVSVCSLLCLATRSAEGQIANVLHSFTGGTSDGGNPYAGLITDSSGNFYGTTYVGGTHGLGTVFELVNSSGSYSEKVLYSFAGYYSGGDGQNPYAGLVMDSSGNLYGTTAFGGANYSPGTVFELVNSSGTYSEKVLYSFIGVDGSEPIAGLIIDSSGNLYGTTYGGGASNRGAVFELVNSSGTYSEKTLYSFTNSGGDGASPYAGLIIDGSGNLYGTTSGGGANSFGTVFELVNSSGSYSEQVLYSFTNSGGDGANPVAGLVMDSSGNLYGTAQSGGAGNGAVFELVNSSGTYSEKVLYGFLPSNGDGQSPGYGTLIMDSTGNLYGTTAYGGGSRGVGTVFELVNSSGAYSEKVLYSFGSGCSDGYYPYAGLVMDSSGNLYGATQAGGTSGAGTVFSLTHLSGPAVLTTTTLAPSSNPATAGQFLLLTANVTSSYGPATGTVTFSEGSTVLGTQSLACGNATLSIPDAEALGIGTYTITAQYNPNVPVLSPSSNTLTQTVNEAGVVLTNGNNTLNGNQTIDGSVSASSVSASSFAGNGSGLTNLTASGLNCTSCVGNPQLAVNYASSASQGGPAANALLLGGFSPSYFQPAGSYATTGANLFTGNQSITGNLSVTGNSSTTGTTTIGSGGTPIVEHLSKTFSPTFTLSGGAVCASEAFTFWGARDGNTVALGVPNERMTATDLIYTAWVSGANKVTIRVCAFSGAPANFGSGPIRVDIWQH